MISQIRPSFDIIQEFSIIRTKCIGLLMPIICLSLIIMLNNINPATGSLKRCFACRSRGNLGDCKIY